MLTLDSYLIIVTIEGNIDIVVFFLNYLLWEGSLDTIDKFSHIAEEHWVVIRVISETGNHLVDSEYRVNEVGVDVRNDFDRLRYQPAY